jgi:nitrogen regulation protein NR(I)
MAGTHEVGRGTDGAHRDLNGIMSKVLLIDDETDVLYSFRRILHSPTVELHTAGSGEEGLQLIPVLKPDLVIMDVRMGGINGLETLRRIRQADRKLLVIIMTAYGTSQTAIEAMKWGAYDYLLKPFDVPKLKQIVANALKAAADMRQVVTWPSQADQGDAALGIVGQSEVMQKVFKLIGQLATTNATVLITGESGTGKELVARAIYHHSARNAQPYLAINCAAIPENLLESELFGHEKGAFTGAMAQRIGKFEQCNQGTLFLDEIGDMSQTTQTKILRVLQSGTFERVGGNEPVQVDVRVIAATNKNLEAAVAARTFREDLYYRLNVVRIDLPPLRERREDIRLLVAFFINKYAELQKSAPKSLADKVLEAMENYAWPGNVRELENAIQRATIMAKGTTILLDDLPQELHQTPGHNVSERTVSPISATAKEPGGGAAVNPPGLAEISQALFAWARADRRFKVIPAVERELVIQALKETQGNQLQAARLLGITRATLRKRMERFKITKELLIQ